MAKRGDVLVARRRLGFGAEGKQEHFVVVQSDPLRDLDTVIVAPLDADGPLYDEDPLVVHVTAKEAGAEVPHVVLAHMLAAALADRFEPRHVSKLSADSLSALDALLRIVLNLP